MAEWLGFVSYREYRPPPALEPIVACLREHGPPAHRPDACKGRRSGSATPSTFDWLAWSPGQSVEWRGAMTLWVLGKLRAHGRIAA